MDFTEYFLVPEDVTVFDLLSNLLSPWQESPSPYISFNGNNVFLSYQLTRLAFESGSKLDSIMFDCTGGDVKLTGYLDLKLRVGWLRPVKDDITFTLYFKPVNSNIIINGPAIQDVLAIFDPNNVKVTGLYFQTNTKVSRWQLIEIENVDQTQLRIKIAPSDSFGVHQWVVYDPSTRTGWFE